MGWVGWSCYGLLTTRRFGVWVGTVWVVLVVRGFGFELRAGLVICCVLVFGLCVYGWGCVVCILFWSLRFWLLGFDFLGFGGCFGWFGCELVCEFSFSGMLGFYIGYVCSCFILY